MKNDQENNIEKNPAGKMTRRNVLTFAVLGGLFALAGLHVAYRRGGWSRSPKFHTKEISCSLEYKRYNGEALSVLFQGTEVGPYTIHSLYVSEGEPDSLRFSIRFPDGASTESLVNFTMRLYSDDGMIIGERSTILRHPHYIAPEWRNVKGTRYDQSGTPNSTTAYVHLLYGNVASNVVNVVLIFEEVESTEEDMNVVSKR